MGYTAELIVGFVLIVRTTTRPPRSIRTPLRPRVIQVPVRHQRITKHTNPTCPIHSQVRWHEKNPVRRNQLGKVFLSVMELRVDEHHTIDPTFLLKRATRGLNLSRSTLAVQVIETTTEGGTELYYNRTHHTTHTTRSSTCTSVRYNVSYLTLSVQGSISENSLSVVVIVSCRDRFR